MPPPHILQLYPPTEQRTSLSAWEESPPSFHEDPLQLLLSLITNRNTVRENFQLLKQHLSHQQCEQMQVFQVFMSSLDRWAHLLLNTI